MPKPLKNRLASLLLFRPFMASAAGERVTNSWGAAVLSFRGRFACGSLLCTPGKALDPLKGEFSTLGSPV